LPTLNVVAMTNDDVLSITREASYSIRRGTSTATEMTFVTFAADVVVPTLTSYISIKPVATAQFPWQVRQLTLQSTTPRQALSLPISSLLLRLIGRRSS
jgi:hypothetical protein